MRTIFVAACLAVLFTISTGSALAASNPSPSGTGQPSQTCVDTSTAANEPGQAAQAPGSAFNENGGTAGGVYAGNQPQNSTNPNSVSQYDVACYQVTQNH